MSFNLRAFIIFFVLLSVFSWFVLEQAQERINIGLRQSAEVVLVDTSQFMAGLIEHELHTQESGTVTVNVDNFSQIFNATLEKRFELQVYALLKKRIGIHVYVTDSRGEILYYSRRPEAKGENYYNWRDVYFTLQGKYGARSSFLDENKTSEDDTKVMVIAAPIKIDDEIVGSISIEKDVQSLSFFLAEETNALRRYMLIALFIVMAAAYLLSHILTLALVKLSNYANLIAQGEQVVKPKFWDQRLTHLSDDIENLREQLDGKAYVEGYVHSLTHELKTPITSIHAATEILKEPLSDAEREIFISTIENSNQRMSLLVERMLSLAKVESLQQLKNQTAFAILPAVQNLVQERAAHIQEKQLQLLVDIPDELNVHGDPLLLEQAIAGVLDNAIDFSDRNSPLKITMSAEKPYVLAIENHGMLIPDFAQEKIFERFFSLPRPDTKRRSTGLGLSFVKEIMRLHQGSVEISNTQHGVVARLYFS